MITGGMPPAGYDPNAAPYGSPPTSGPSVDPVAPSPAYVPMYSPPPETTAPPATDASSPYAPPRTAPSGTAPRQFGPPASPASYPPAYPPTQGYPPASAYPPPSGYPPPPGYPTYPATPPWTPARPGRDGLSIASFILSLFSVLIVSIPLSIAGLVRTSAGKRRGRGFAIAGLAVSIVWVLVIVGLVAFAAGRKPDRSADGTVTHQGSISPASLRVGDCVKLPPITAGENQVHSLVTVVPCSVPHNAQVFTIVQSTDASYPGLSTLLQEGLSACSDAVPAFIGKSASELEVADFVPSQQLWNTGDRSERCLLIDSAEDITGDIRPHA